MIIKHHIIIEVSDQGCPVHIRRWRESALFEDEPDWQPWTDACSVSEIARQLRLLGLSIERDSQEFMSLR